MFFTESTRKLAENRAVLDSCFFNLVCANNSRDQLESSFSADRDGAKLISSSCERISGKRLSESGTVLGSDETSRK